jgi:PAS domain S-box-containing protein
MPLKQKNDEKLMYEIKALKESIEELEAAAGTGKDAPGCFRVADALLCKVFETIPDLFSFIDKEYRILLSNWHGGYENVPDQLEAGGSTVCYKVYSKKDTPCEWCHIAEVFRAGKPVIYEKADPNIGQVEISAFPVLDESGSVILVTENIRDITKRKEDEESLRRLNRELRATSSCNQIMVRAADEQTLLNEVCRIVCEEAGYRMAWVGYVENGQAKTIRPVAWAGSEDEYIGQAGPVWGDTEPGLGLAGTAVRGGETLTVQDFAIDPRMARWREEALRRGYRSGIALPLKDENGKVFGVFMVLSSDAGAVTPSEISLLEELSGDLAFGVTTLRARAKHTQAEEALRESEELFRITLENILDPMLITNDSGAFTFISPNVPLVLGYSMEEIQTMGNVSTLFGREIFACETMGTQGESRDFECSIVKKNGERRDYLISAERVSIKEGTILYLCHDITERKRLEEQLRQSQKMEAVGLLAGGIAHDFNNLLQAIMGYGHLLQMKMMEDDSLRLDVDKVLAATEKAAGLTRSLLAFSRKQVMSFHPANLNEILANVEKFLTRVIGEEIRICTEFKEETLNINADIGQIEQVIMNLATNARDAMPHGGVLTIATGSTEMDEKFVSAHGYGDPGRYALISVTDTGAGMDAATIRRIFEPFFTTKEMGRGTGLGLAIVYGIVKQHNGHITVYSEPGMGTTFRIYLPLLKSAHGEAEPIAGQPQPGRGTETILIAEDDRQIRGVLRAILTEFGYTVVEAADGEDALEKFIDNSNRIHLLLMDVIMPKKRGNEVYDEIRKMGSEVKAIFLSGYPPDFVHGKLLLEEGLDVIMKPVSPQNLLKKIREVLDEEKRGAPLEESPYRGSGILCSLHACEEMSDKEPS